MQIWTAASTLNKLRLLFFALQILKFSILLWSLCCFAVFLAKSWPREARLRFKEPWTRLFLVFIDGRKCLVQICVFERLCSRLSVTFFSASCVLRCQFTIMSWYSNSRKAQQMSAALTLSNQAVEFLADCHLQKDVIFSKLFFFCN